jgi:hypothetical protein
VHGGAVKTKPVFDYEQILRGDYSAPEFFRIFFAYTVFEQFAEF